MILGLLVLAAWVIIAIAISIYSGSILLSMVIYGTSLEGLTLVFAICFLLFGALLSWGFALIVYNSLKKDRIL